MRYQRTLVILLILAIQLLLMRQITLVAAQNYRQQASDLGSSNPCFPSPPVLPESHFAVLFSVLAFASDGHAS